jgi:F0F1-type ATP synthase delta subunit
MYQEKKKKITATVITPSVIGGEYEQRLAAALGDITGRDVSIEYRTDPSLLGGMLIQVGSTMFDGSIKGQLRLLKEELVKG